MPCGSCRLDVESRGLPLALAPPPRVCGEGHLALPSLRPPLPPAVRRLAARVPRPRVLDATHACVAAVVRAWCVARCRALTHRWRSPQLFAVSTPLLARPRRGVTRRGCRRRLDRLPAPLRRRRHRRRARHRALGACAALAAPCETAKARCGLIIDRRRLAHSRLKRRRAKTRSLAYNG